MYIVRAGKILSAGLLLLISCLSNSIAYNYTQPNYDAMLIQINGAFPTLIRLMAILQPSYCLLII